MVALVQKQLIIKYIYIDNAVIKRVKPNPVHTIFLRYEKRRPNPTRTKKPWAKAIKTG